MRPVCRACAGCVLCVCRAGTVRAPCAYHASAMQCMCMQVWTSKGTGGARASVWAPSLGGGLASANKVRLCLGHHAATGLEEPRGPLVLELHDTAKNGMQTSKALPRAQAQLLPHPLSYRQVWSRAVGGAQPLFVWRPLPPSAAFVALGNIATSTAQPPPLEAVRCLCRAMHELRRGVGAVHRRCTVVP